MPSTKGLLLIMIEISGMVMWIVCVCVCTPQEDVQHENAGTISMAQGGEV